MIEANSNKKTGFDLELAKRYDRPGPRYTSYPTANHFHEQFTLEHYRQLTQCSNEDPLPSPLSLYFHIPFCASPCFYCGCTRVITRNYELATRYRQSLQRELELQSKLFDADRQVTQIHFGGGTPSFFRDADIQQVLDTLREHFNVASGSPCEIGIEIDPRTVDANRLQTLAALGFNRLSMGIQDFDPEVQQAINRVQSLEHSADIMAAAQRAHFRSINLDLIYGLPKQTEASFARTLEAVIQLRPSRIAAYSYAHLPAMFKAQKHILSEQLPSPEAKLALLALTVEKLTQAGYLYIGMDHFALPFDELARARCNGSLRRNFQGYSTQAHCDLIGIGMSSISQIGDGYAQNQKQLALYHEHVDRSQLPIHRGLRLSDDDQLRRTLIERLLCRGRIDIPEFETEFDLEFALAFSEDLKRLEPLRADGLLECSRETLQVTNSGRFLLRAVAMCFDRHLHRAPSQPASFSKLI